MLTASALRHYASLVVDVSRQFEAIPEGSTIRLAKQTSNLFRPRARLASPGLDVSGFDGVLAIDTAARTADVLGMTTYEHLVQATLPHGLIPMCVPQLRTITLGGAVTGMGIEAASFRQGAPHESVLEMDILTGTGDVLTVTGGADDPHRDLFAGFPNSYGSLGYALRIRIELEPVQPYVHLRHVRYSSAEQLTEAITTICAARAHDGHRVDFIDGTVFAPDEHYLTLGTMVPVLPAHTAVSDYTGQSIYYRSIQQRSEDWLTILDYLWRWDTDWFWCSRAFGAQVPAIRRMWPRARLRSDVYWKLIAIDHRHHVAARLNALRRRPQRESVVQDIEVPAARLPEFLDFFHREVGIEPIWICPLQQRDPHARWPLYEFDPATLYVNVGFWSSVALPAGMSPEDGSVNRRIEAEVTRLDGRKSLYSTAFYDRDTFWSIYGGSEYPALKERYDPQGRLLGLYEKVVEQR
ncbi:MAG: FAD-binding oxidoreductase [Candidatus Nanopelagicales bacterium]|nr:FAD-binding oxidoreductase [Candidatus Nanopelagicales bacterium]